MTLFGVPRMAVIVLLLAPPITHADNASADAPNELQAIHVTAQKREQPIQDVPISIGVVTKDTLASRDLYSSNDLANAVSGLQVTGAYADSNSNFSIRGIGSTEFTQNYEAPVGLYIDEVYLGSPVDSAFALFDLDRVEVLRGPQGTLFGKNTTAGAISAVSTKPTAQLEGDVSLSTGNFGYVEPRADLNIPISNDLAVRIAGVSEKRDGTLQSVVDNPGSVDARLNDIDRQAARMSALYEPNEFFRALFIASGGWNNSDGAFSAPYNNIFDNPYVGSSNGFVLEDVRTSGYTLNLSWNWDAFTLTSISAYRHNSLHRREEPSAFKGTDGDFQVQWFSKFHQLSEEMRLAPRAPGRLNWITGIYVYEDGLSANNSAQYPDPAESYALNWRLGQSIRDVAAFAQSTYALTSKLRATLGGRLTNDEQNFHYENLYTAITDPYAIGVAPALVFQQRNTYNDWSGKLGLDYYVVDTTMLYASVSRGFNIGTHSGLAFTTAALTATRPEFLIDYEIGSKSTSDGSRVTLNLDAFLCDYRDIIVATTENVGGITLAALDTNAATARSEGFEVESAIKLGAHLSINASVSYTDAKYTSFHSLLVSDDINGNQLPNAPKWSFVGSASYMTEVWRDKQLTLSVDETYVDSFHPDAKNAPQIAIAAHRLTDARLALRFHSGLTIALWGKNLFNEIYQTYGYNEPSIASVTGGPPYGFFYGDPRTYGLALDQKF